MKKGMFEQTDKMVRGLARFYGQRCRGVQFDDLVQEGWVAALEAEQTWDPTRGRALMAYLYPAVWRAMRELVVRWRAPASVPLRKALVVNAPVAVELPELHAHTPSPEVELWRSEVRARLAAVFSELRHPRAVARILLDGSKPNELARGLRAKPRQLWRQTNKARRKLKQDPALRALSEGGTP